jgi:signal transduction histidine kinase
MSEVRSQPTTDPQDAELGSWRESVLQRMLSVSAVVAPPLAALGLLVQPSRRSALDVIVLCSTAGATVLLRFARRLPVGARAFSVIAILFLASNYVLGRTGFAAGVTSALLTTCLLGAIYLGLRFGLVMVALMTMAYVDVGLLATHGHLVIDRTALDPTDLRNWVRMAGVTGLLATLLVVVINTVIRHVEQSSRAARDALARLQRAYQQLGQLHGRLEATKEEERRFLAHELHDELGQSLTALKLRLALGAKPGAGPNGSTPEALALVDDLIARVRKMSGDLRPPLLDEIGLVPAVRAYLDSQAAVSGVPMELEVQPEEPTERLAPDVEIASFRVIQESVTNALRHAAPHHVQVRIGRNPTHLTLMIRDDGRGFDPSIVLERAAAGGHLGIVGMRERVRASAGAFKLGSLPGGGTIVEVELPYASTA